MAEHGAWGGGPELMCFSCKEWRVVVPFLSALSAVMALFVVVLFGGGCCCYRGLFR